MREDLYRFPHFRSVTLATCYLPARKKFYRRSQPEFPEAFKMIFRAFFLSAVGLERRISHLSRRTSKPPLAAGCRTFSRPVNLTGSFFA